MAPANRMPVSDLRKFAVAALIVVGVFLLCCGTGMSNVVVGGAGVVLAVGGPLLVLFTGAFGNAKLYEYGTAHVADVPSRPTTGPTGRCELELIISTHKINGVRVRIRDSAVPVNKWPEVGATLPVRIAAGNPRKVKILWDDVRTHQEAVNDDRVGPGFATLSDEEREQVTEDVEFDHGPLPPDDRPTVTDLPVIDADAEPAGEQLLVMDRTNAVPAQRGPEEDAVVGSPIRRKPSPRPRRSGRGGRAGTGPGVGGGGGGIAPPSAPTPAHAAPDEVVPDELIPESDLATPESDVEPAAAAVEPENAQLETIEEAEEAVEEAEEEAEEAEEEEAEEAELETIEEAAEEEEEEEPEILEPEAPPQELEAAHDQDVEAYLPSPYVTEIYAPPPEDLTPDLRTPRIEAAEEDTAVDPADELERVPFQDGAVAQFLAATPRRRAVPLEGVNGVSITLIVSDLQRSRRFYRDTLGLSELDSSTNSAVLASGDARVVLRRVADMPPVDRRVVHLNLEVPDVYEAYERLRAEGVEFVHRPRVVPQGEQLDLCSATFRDPDGHAIALTRWELRR